MRKPLFALLFVAGILLPPDTQCQTDHFGDAVLDSQWYWIREDTSAWSLTERPGYMRLYTYGDLYADNNSAHLLLQQASDDSFAIITKITIAPMLNYNQGGLTVYADDDNYLKLVRARIAGSGPGQCISFLREVGGSTQEVLIPCELTELWLLIEKEQEEYSASFSADGVLFQSLGTMTVALGDEISAGLVAFNGVPDGLWSLPADFDYFLYLGPWLCGDADSSGFVNISDAVYLISYIFCGGPPPDPLSAGDCNCDGIVNITDAVYLISYIFSGGPPPCDPDDDGVPDC